jgi:HPt (histidine-containing phosphotransfer) domain-containing protein
VSAVRALQRSAQATNVARAGRLADTLDVIDHGALDEAERLGARDVAHQILGSAGTFGFPRTSQLASRLEHFFVAGHFGRHEVRTARDWLAALQLDLLGEPVVDEDDGTQPW